MTTSTTTPAGTKATASRASEAAAAELLRLINACDDCIYELGHSSVSDAINGHIDNLFDQYPRLRSELIKESFDG